ncbi:hypothetical protein ABZ502_34160 [Streptomyces abikoensis]|uniref:hypothetical protein n=1 Tax=Streptomyces abikoensis TaxID=97398 RepID=UPI0033EE5C33
MPAALLETNTAATIAPPDRPSTARSHRRDRTRENTFRQLMAEAVWNDLREFKRLKRAANGTGYTFRYSGRSYALRRNTTATGRPSRDWAIILTDEIDTQFPFTADAKWTGRTREAAVKALVIGVQGHLCPHKYVTGQDSCPCCDAYTEE